MRTFFEVFITAAITFCTGFLFLKYRSVPKRKLKHHPAGQFNREQGNGVRLDGKTAKRSLMTNAATDHRTEHKRKYPPQLIWLLLLGMTFFSVVCYLVEKGMIILKW